MNEKGMRKVRVGWLIPVRTRRQIDLMAAMEGKRASNLVAELVEEKFEETMESLNGLDLDTVDGFDGLSDVDKDVEQRR